MSISNNALIFYHTYTIESKKKSVYFTDFSIKTSFSLEYRDGFERLLGYDPKKARELLKEAGYPNGFTTEIWSGYSNSTSAKVVQFLQQQLAQVGIKTTTRMLEPGVRAQIVYGVKDPKEAKSRLYYIGWADGSMDPDWVLRPLLDSRQAPPKFMNTSYYSNPKFDALLDEAKRTALYQQAQKMVWNDAPWAYLVYEVGTAGADARLKNFHLRADTGIDFREAYWDESESGK